MSNEKTDKNETKNEAENETDSEQDIEHIKTALAGDKGGFDLLVQKYQGRILAIIRRSIRDQSIALDLTQDVFISAYRNLGSFKGDSGFYTWLYRITVNTLRNYLRGGHRRVLDIEINYEQPRTLPGRFKVKDYATPENWLICDEMQEVLEVIMAGLPQELSQSIILRDIEGMTYDEIAIVMDCPMGTVRSRIYRARSLVDQSLKPFLKI